MRLQLLLGAKMIKVVQLILVFIVIPIVVAEIPWIRQFHDCLLPRLIIAWIVIGIFMYISLGLYFSIVKPQESNTRNYQHQRYYDDSYYDETDHPDSQRDKWIEITPP